MKPREGRRHARPATSGLVVTRVVDYIGTVSFAGTSYRAGNAWAHRSVQVALVAESVRLSCDGQIIRVHSHPIRHDHAKEHGAVATPNGRPRHQQAAPAGVGVPDAGG